MGREKSRPVINQLNRKIILGNKMSQNISTVLVVSPTKHTLTVRKKKHFSNTEDLTFDFEPGEPLKMPKDIAEVYCKSFPYKYKIVTGKSVQEESTEEEPEGKTESDSLEFDPIKFIDEVGVTEESLADLQMGQLLPLAAKLAVPGINPKAGKEKAIAKILKKVQAVEKEE